jgi:hypothetical protein
MRGNKPHGEGLMVFSGPSLLILPSGGRLLTEAITGGEYDGKWVDGERHGKGRFKFKGTEFKARCSAIFVDHSSASASAYSRLDAVLL